MCTVAELISKLQTLPQEAIVEVKRDYVVGWDTIVEFAPANIEFIDVFDFTGPEYQNRPQVAGKILIQLSSD